MKKKVKVILWALYFISVLVVALLTKGLTYINGDLQSGATMLFWIIVLAFPLTVFVLSPIARKMAEREVKTE